MAQTKMFKQFLEEIGQIERIPGDREPTTKEVRHVDDLVVRLRVAAEPGGKRYGYLYSKAMAVQARLNGADRAEPVEQSATPSASDASPQTPYQRLTAEADQAERMPVSREPNAEGIELVDGLKARMKGSAVAGAEYMNLHRRAKAVRPHTRGSGDSESVAHLSVSSRDVAPAKKKAIRTVGKVRKELSRFEAIKRPLKPEELLRLDELVNETRTLIAKNPNFESMHRWAKLIHKDKTTPTRTVPRQPEGLRAVLPAGLVGSPGLDLAKREVLGGLPSSRRGH